MVLASNSDNHRPALQTRSLKEVGMKKKITLLVLAALLLTMGVAASGENHIRADLVPVGESGVSGVVKLVQFPRGGTNIRVLAMGLTPGEEYVSLYYDNHDCTLEPDSAEDMIGGAYTGNDAGMGTTRGRITDNLDQINSVSVRLAGDLTLLACADIHPAP
jgi:hypothetical protein